MKGKGEEQKAIQTTAVLHALWLSVPERSIKQPGVAQMWTATAQHRQKDTTQGSTGHLHEPQKALL
jgi:hypothetical protein